MSSIDLGGVNRLLHVRVGRETLANKDEDGLVLPPATSPIGLAYVPNDCVLINVIIIMLDDRKLKLP